MVIFARAYDKALLAGETILVSATALFQESNQHMVSARCRPNRSHLLVSFTEQAAAKHTGHRAGVLMAERTLHPLLAAAATIRHQ